MSSHASGSTPDADTDTPAERTARVARVRSEIDAGIWMVIWLSLAFTAINVQIFAARGAEIWSLAWCAAWLLDPMVSILVLVVVRAEQITSRWQVQLGWPITATKWGCFAATYAMNTWSSWVERSPSMIVLHSVPPAMMLLAAEVGPRIRDGLTRAVLAANAQQVAAALPADAVASHDVRTPDSVPDPHPLLPTKPELTRAGEDCGVALKTEAPATSRPRGSASATSLDSADPGLERTTPEPATADSNGETVRDRVGPSGWAPASSTPQATVPSRSDLEPAAEPVAEPVVEPVGREESSPDPAASPPGVDAEERNERVWRLARAMLQDARDQGLAGRDVDGGIVEDAWSGSRAVGVLGGSRRNGQRLVSRAAALARALQQDNPPTPPRGSDLGAPRPTAPAGDEPGGDDVGADTAPDPTASLGDADRTADSSRPGGPELHVVGRAR